MKIPKLPFAQLPRMFPLITFCLSDSLTSGHFKSQPHTEMGHSFQSL